MRKDQKMLRWVGLDGRVVQPCCLSLIRLVTLPASQDACVFRSRRLELVVAILTILAAARAGCSTVGSRNRELLGGRSV